MSPVFYRSTFKGWLALAMSFLGVLVPLESWARLGETETELALRYGQPQKTEDLGRTRLRLSFQQKGYTITATLLYGNCQHIVYRLPSGEYESNREALLQANGRGLVWAVPPSSPSIEGSRLLVRSDGEAYVQLPEYAGQARITFYTRKWADWMKKEEAESVQPKSRPNF